MGRKRKRGRRKGIKFPKGYVKHKGKKIKLKFGGYKYIKTGKNQNVWIPIYKPRKNKPSKSRKRWR